MKETFPDQEKFLRTVLDAIPSFVFVIDSALRIVDANRAAQHMTGKELELNLRRLCGDVLHCMHARESIGGCGTTEFCPDCAVRNAVNTAQEGRSVTRQRSKMKLQETDTIREVNFLVTAAPLEYNKANMSLVIFEDVTELIELQGLIPICSSCKKVRNDENYWEQVESYLSKHTDFRFTHSLCPECVKKLYPEFNR